MTKPKVTDVRRNALFFRLLAVEPEARGKALRQAIAAVNGGEAPEGAYALDPGDFSQVPGTPFAYWVSDRIRSLFRDLPPFESEGRTVKVGLQTGDDFRFVRAWWEVPPEKILDAANGPDWRQDLEAFQAWCRQRTFQGKRWVPFAKGGEYSPFYADIHLVVNWENDGEELKAFTPRAVIRNPDYYFRPGLTWPRRTSGNIAVRTFSSGSIFADKGPVAFPPEEREERLLTMLGVMVSRPFQVLVGFRVAAGDIARSYEVGVIQRMPVPSLPRQVTQSLATAVAKAVLARRRMDGFREETRTFTVPFPSPLPSSLQTSATSLEGLSRKALAEVVQSQAMTDSVVAEGYGVPELAEGIPDTSLSAPNERGDGDAQDKEDEKEDESEVGQVAVFEITIGDVAAQAVMYALGIAFGRWDVRFALDPSLLPELQGPFDPLPVCPPGALVGPDGLPAAPGRIVSEAWLRARPNVIRLPEKVDGPEIIPDEEYPVPIAWDGILVDDPGHEKDIVAAVRRVLQVIWGERAGDIEAEACQILGYDSLRDYFRDARKGFFDFHIKRYSKSRRKAPIYWLLQSERRNYAVWLYYHRLTKDTLFRVGREYVDAKIALEEERLAELESGLEGLQGSARKAREREIDRQRALVEEVKAFGKTLDEVARLELTPELNDGVLLNIAPLHALVPWKEASKAWEELLQGKYDWSSIGAQLRAKGLVRK